MAINRDLVQKGNKLRSLEDEINRKWIRVSLWKKASDIWFNDGTNFNQILEREIKKLKDEIMRYLTADNGVIFQFGSEIDDGPTGEYPVVWMPQSNISNGVDFGTISNTITFTVPHPRNIPVVFTINGTGIAKLYQGNTEIASHTVSGTKTVNYNFQRNVEYRSYTEVPLGVDNRASITFTRIGGNPLGVPDDDYSYGCWVNGELIYF